MWSEEEAYKDKRYTVKMKSNTAVTIPEEPIAADGCTSKDNTVSSEQSEKFNQLLGDIENHDRGHIECIRTGHTDEIYIHYNAHCAETNLNLSALEDLEMSTDETRESLDEWIVAHQNRLRYAYEKNGEQTKDGAEYRKTVHDQKRFNPEIVVGDKVYIRNRGVHGRNKIQDI
ncbi:unnamed protein product [Mytilus coruscus]|uniref:Uncharacterized protein n=1 Tax=Mytilus coruscus TaxID=42192 RepID=A0A6J8BCW6_MYTCO|nr:unnamed protein product [Mytilus coruscus]